MTLARRLAAAVALSCTAALFPLLALSAPAQAAEPDCSVEQEAFDAAAGVRDGYRSLLTGFVANVHTPAREARIAATAAKEKRKDERAEALSTLAAARAAYADDPSPATLEAVATARADLGRAAQALAAARQTYRDTSAALATATDDRRVLNATLKSAKADTAAAREALESCLGVLDATVTNVYLSNGIQYGDVTVSSVPAGTYVLYPEFLCSGLPVAQCSTGAGVAGPDGVLRLSPAGLALCPRVSTESFTLYRDGTFERVGIFDLTWTAVC